MEQNPDNEVTKYKPANPVLTLLGLNRKQLIFTIFAWIAVSIVIIYSDEIGDLGMTALIIIGLSVFGIFYIKNRKKFIQDFEEVKLDGVPLMPAHTRQLSRREVILIVSGAILFGLLGIFISFLN